MNVRKAGRRKWGEQKEESEERRRKNVRKTEGTKWREQKEETDVSRRKQLRKVELSFLSAIVEKRIKKEERKGRRINSWKTSYILILKLEIRTSNTFLIINLKYKPISNQ